MWVEKNVTQYYMRDPITIATECFVIGFMNVALFYVLRDRITQLSNLAIIFICGVLIHLLFEVFGGNEWWCRSTYKL